MSGPIVRTGTTPEFWKNWDQVFGNKAGGSKSDKKSATEAKAARSAVPKKAAKKSAKKAAAKKK